MQPTTAFWLGTVGGVFVELLGIFELRHTKPEALPHWIKSPFYWIVSGAMALMGGVLTSIYVASGVSLTPILAVNIGASSPLIISGLATQTPKVPIKVR